MNEREGKILRARDEERMKRENRRLRDWTSDCETEKERERKEGRNGEREKKER